MPDNEYLFLQALNFQGGIIELHRQDSFIIVQLIKLDVD